MNLGGPELLILVALAALIFGAGWLPKAARNLGKAKVEFDDASKQFADAKKSVVEATGVKELEATMRKANKALNTSPQKMLKDAAKSATTGGAQSKETVAADADADSDIEDAEIVDRSTNAEPGTTDSGGTSGDGNPSTTDGDGTINVDFA